ncbi:MAG: hypothetical protein WCL18_08765 [bacterium]
MIEKQYCFSMLQLLYFIISSMLFVDEYTKLFYKIYSEKEEEEKYGDDGEFDNEDDADDDEVLILRGKILKDKNIKTNS